MKSLMVLVFVVVVVGVSGKGGKEDNTAFLFILIVSAVVVVVGIMSVQTGDPIYISYNNYTGCNGTAPVLNKPYGDLDIEHDVQLAGKTCEWLIDGSSYKTGLNVHLDLVENLILGSNDSFEITSEDNKTTYFKAMGFSWPGVVLIGDIKKVRVKLILANENITRNFDVKYGTTQSSVQIQDIESTTSFVFPLNKEAELKSDFKIILKSKNSENKLLLNLESFDLNDGSVNISKVEKYNDSVIKSGQKEGLPEFLLQKDKQIYITVSKFSKLKPESKGLHFSIDLVTSVCSQYKLITDFDDVSKTTDLILPNNDTLQSLSSYRCLNIFEHNDTSVKLLLDLRTFEFKNIGDSLTLLDGNSRNSSTLAIIEQSFLKTYWRDLYLYSSANKMWIMFESPHVLIREADTSGIGVQPYSEGGNTRLNVSAPNYIKLEVSGKSKAPNPVFVYSADSDKQIIIDFDEKKPLPGTVEIYESGGRSGKPFISFVSGQYPPDIIASNNNELKVVFKQNFDLTANVTTVGRGCHSTYIGTSGASFSLSGQCTGLCSWLIPKKDNSNGTFILQFSHLNLTKEVHELMIRKLGTTSSEVLHLEGPLTTMTFPDLILDANETYVLYMTRKDCEKSPKPDGSLLIGVSIIFVDNDLTTHEEVVDKDKTYVLQTSNYPNYYSVGSDHLWRITNSSVNETALLSFTDIDLNSGHQLLVRGKGLDLVVSNLSIVSSDRLVQFPLFMNLTSTSIDGKKQPFSGRGFNATLTTASCGQAFSGKKDAEISLSTPTDLKGVTKCIWTVTTENLNNSVVNYLDFELNDKDLNLTIWDSESIRDNKKIHISYFNTTRISSSTNSLIIEYTIDAKNPKPLNLNFKPKACDKMCVNTKRCIIPEFLCNGIDDCGDYSDERYCNGISPPPTPEPLPIVYHSGVNGWVVTLVICPLMIGIGVLGTIFGPRLLNRYGRGRYREFQDFSEVS